MVSGSGGSEASLEKALRETGNCVRRTDSVAGAAALVEPCTEAVFTGIALRDGNWRDLVEQVRLRAPSVPVILCCAATDGTAELWWDALECNILDIVSPPYSAQTLRRVLDGDRRTGAARPGA